MAATTADAAATSIHSISTPHSGSPLIAITLDSGERLLVSPDRVIGLAAGDALDGSAVEALRSGAHLDRLEGRLMRLLAVRWRSRAELAARLAGWGASEADAAELLARLERQGLLDEQRLAADISRDLRRRGHGRVRAAHELERLDVDDEIAVETVTAHAESDPEAAARLVEKRFGAGPYDAATCRKAAAVLARRGFDENTIGRILDL
jgi:regulatory protein